HRSHRSRCSSTDARSEASSKPSTKCAIVFSSRHSIVSSTATTSIRLRQSHQHHVFAAPRKLQDRASRRLLLAAPPKRKDRCEKDPEAFHMDTDQSSALAGIPSLGSGGRGGSFKRGASGADGSSVRRLTCPSPCSMRLARSTAVAS